MTFPPDTICALATAEGGALCVVRVSGPAAEAVARRLLHRRDGRPRFPAGARIEPRRVYHAFVRDAGGVVDECLAHLAVAPRSYTAEDTLELSGHGGPAAARRLLAACLSAGARLAGPGEFTRRAFLNRRFDLPSAEAVGDLVAARTEACRASAAARLSGGLSGPLVALRDRLLDLDARLSAALDFPEEGVDAVEMAPLRGELARIEASIAAALERSRYECALRDGITVAIVGRPNVGKSSLFNRLFGAERAIVSPVPGTTRDVVGEWIDLAGMPAKLLDTAGVRDDGDALEAEGRRRALAAAEAADLRLLVLDRSAPLQAGERDLLARIGPPRLLLLNKCDLPPALDPDALPPGEPALSVSAETGAGLEALVAACGAALGARAPAEGPVAANARQAECLRLARAALIDAREAGTLDLAAEGVRQAARAIAELLGDTYTDALLDRIFEKFCIGK